MSKNNIVDWNTIYNEQAGQLLGLCRRYVRNTQLAEDLVHDGFIKAMENVQSYNGHGSFEGWLKRVVINNVLEYLRTNKKTTFTNIEDVTITEEQSVGYTDSTIKSLVQNSNFTQTELLEVIDLLPDHHKTVFNLYVIDDYSHKEISDLLQIEISTSKSHLSRARKKIQQLLVEKASEMKKDKENKKRKRLLGVLPLAGVSAKANTIDRLFKEAFANYKLPTPNQSANLKKIISKAKPVRITSKYGIFQSAAGIYWGVGISGTILLGAIAYNEFSPKEVNHIPLKPKIEQKSPSCICNEKEKTSLELKETQHTDESLEASNNTTKKGTSTNIRVNEPTKAPEQTPPINTTENTVKTTAQTKVSDTAKNEPVVVRKQVVIRKQVIIDENAK